MTHVFSAIIGVLGALAVAHAAESQAERKQDEVRAAQNELDTLLLQPGMKANDPRVKAKAQALAEKLKAFREEFSSGLNPPKSVAVKSNSAAKPEGSPVPEAEPSPGFTLSGENIPAEITYTKKEKPKAKRGKVAPSPLPTETGEAPAESPEGAAAPGTSEIQYPKKKTR